MQSCCCEGEGRGRVEKRSGLTTDEYYSLTTSDVYVYTGVYMSCIGAGFIGSEELPRF